MKKCSDFIGEKLKMCPSNVCKLSKNKCVLKKSMNDEEEHRFITNYLDKSLDLTNIQFNLDDQQQAEVGLNSLDLLNREIDNYKTTQNFCIFGNNIELLTNHFDNYTIPNASIIEKTHMCVGSGRNGFQVKVGLSKDDISNEILLKSSNLGNNDNLIYEYLVGLCVNKLCLYFPIFCKTYGVCKYKNDGYLNLIKSQCFKFGVMIGFENSDNINDYLENLNISNLEQSIINGCTHRFQLCLLIQYYESTTMFNLYNHYLDIDDIPLVSHLITILHFVYEGLNKLKDMFTHYDLHSDNVLLYKIPDDQYVEIIYHNDTTSNEYHVKTKYIPIIIDYGHSFINCDEIDRSIDNSNQIFTTVCNNDRNSDNPVCHGICGWESGFFYNNPPNKNNYYISNRMPNRSHDLKLLKSFYNETDLSQIENESPYLEEFSKFLSNVIVQDQYGTPELNTREVDKINNVEQAAEGLRSIIQMHSFIEHNENIFTSKKKYGTLHVWIDKLKQYEFIIE
jgi:hypothetical protein